MQASAFVIPFVLYLLPPCDSSPTLWRGNQRLIGTPAFPLLPEPTNLLETLLPTHLQCGCVGHLSALPAPSQSQQRLPDSFLLCPQCRFPGSSRTCPVRVQDVFTTLDTRHPTSASSQNSVFPPAQCGLPESSSVYSPVAALEERHF